MKLTHDNNKTKKAKDGMTLLELTVVILVLLTLISTLFIGVNAWKKGSERAGCILNIRTAQQATRAFANVNQLGQGDALNMPVDLVGPGNYIEETLLCPSTGIYTETNTIPPVGTLAMTCSLATPNEHEPQIHTDW